MQWNPKLAKNDEPLFASLVKILAQDITNGNLQFGTRLPTQRELADELKIAVGTVTRAYKEAEKRGLIHGDGRRGTFVGELPRGRRLLSSLNAQVSAGIDLGKNHPAPALDPNLAAALKRIAVDPRVQNLLLYPPPMGLPHHREAGARWFETIGFNVEEDSIFLTSGAQHALLVIFAAESRAGDIVAVEEFTYPGVKAIAETLGLELVGIPMDDEGIIPDALETVCRHRNIRLLYFNPSHQNPTNRFFSDARKVQIANLAEKYDLTVVEDDILRPMLDEFPAPVTAAIPRRSYFIVSTSKAVAAGLRLGFVAAPKDSRQRLIDSLQASNLGGPPLMAEIFSHWLNEGITARTITKRKQTLGKMYDLVCDSLKDFNIRSHRTSYHVWLELPDGWTSANFTTKAQNRGVIVAPGEIFDVARKSPALGVRLSIGGISDPEYLRRGLNIIREILSGSPLKSPVTV